MILFALIATVVLGIAFVMTYNVVEPNEAHVVTVMGAGRKIYSPKFSEEVGTKTSYFYIPFLMKRIVLPLQNVKVGITDIKLNDKEVAPFVCDVIAWITVLDPIVAAEKLDSSNDDIFESLRMDLSEIVRAVSRTTSMRQEILEIMRDRKAFSESVSSEVGEELKKFGVSLVNLEINDIKDDLSKESTIISDYESIRKINIDSVARIKIAEKNREAVEAEQSNRQKAEIAIASAEEALRKRQIEKDEAVGIADQNRVMKIAVSKEAANAQEVSALRKKEVGIASVKKEATIEQASGEAEAIRITGEKEADVVRLKGEADGKAIAAKGTAEATAKDKMAEAMAKFNDSALNVEKIRAFIEIQTAKWQAYGSVAKNADIKVVNSGGGADLFGMPINAESGADLGQFLESMGKIDGIKGVAKKVVDAVVKK